MGIIEKIKSLSKKKKISYLSISIIFLYGLVAAILFITVSSSLVNTLKDIRIPDDYFYIDFDPLNPSLEMSFSVTNTGFFDINEFYMKMSFDLVYSDKNNNTRSLKKIFLKTQNFGRIPLLYHYYNILTGDSSCFNITALEEFWNHVNLNYSIYSLFDISISGKYCFDAIPFNIEIKKVNITVF